MSRDFLSFGLIVSLACHFFLGILVVPVMKDIPDAAIKSSSVFLGSFLKEQDLLPSFIPKNNAVENPSLRFMDFSKRRDFNKESNPVDKPNIFFAHLAPKNREPMTVSEKKPAQAVTGIAFGFSDFSDYLYQADFSDLKKMALREELASFMDFRVLLSGKGEVKAIKKIIGSGDPAFDLYVILKLKKAIFKSYLYRQQEGWLNVRFRVK